MENSENLELLLKLTSIKSDTGTKEEKDVEHYIWAYLKGIPNLVENETFGLSYLPNDSNGRAVVWGLVKGKGKETIVLINHHDVVDSYDYGSFQQYAYKPNALKKALQSIDHSEEVSEDLSNEDWLFGRGTADMKAGLAIQLNLMKDYSGKKDFEGNLLFLSVPDEESLSAGMRHGAQLLVDIMKKNGLNYKLLINSEPHERESNQYRIYDSSVGKTMATVYVQGKKSHIGKIFEGLSPSLILSKIVLNTELNSELCDIDLGEISPPPSWSYVRDFKDCYDASIPEAAGGYVSFLTMNKTPKKLLNDLKEICTQSFKETTDYMSGEFMKLYPKSDGPPTYAANVKLYEELLADARLKDDDLTEKTLKEKFEAIKGMIHRGEITIPESNFIIIKALLNIAAYNIPTIVIALSPPYYPHVSSQKNPEHIKTINEIIENTKEFDLDYVHYFMGISDLSYVGLQNGEDVVPYVSPNMPLWREDFYTIPFEAMGAVSMPMMIIGPWGKDIHKMTERVYIPDLVENTPLLIERLIEMLL